MVRSASVVIPPPFAGLRPSVSVAGSFSPPSYRDGKSPFFEATLRWGAAGFSVYNHMYIPRDFGNTVQNFWNLVNDAILCDVAVERQVEVTGPDAAQFVQLLTGRNLEKLAIGQCKYVLITNDEGGIFIMSPASGAKAGDKIK